MSLVRTILTFLLLVCLGASQAARSQPVQDGEELGAVSFGSSELAKDDSLADGLYMSGTWTATYTVGFTAMTIALPFIHNTGTFTSGTLRLSFWATTSYPARGEGFTGYRLATFPTLAPLGPGFYQNILQSASMLTPPNGTYWLVLVLEEYYPSACPSSTDGYCLADSTISFSQRTFGSTAPDVVVSQTLSVSPAIVGKDAIADVTVTNTGPGTATGVTLTMTHEASTSAIWVSPGCVKQGVSPTYACSIGTMTSGASSRFRLVLRRAVAGFLTNAASVTSTSTDANTANNTANVSTNIVAGTAGIPVLRYRLYSPVSLEHHFTTDLNEYTVLGASGAWIQEGTVGRVLNNPGSFNGVAAVPYYRLYNTTTRWHHWTTDANEYYTLVTFPGWNGEGVDGYILPTIASGSRQLFRLVYPNGTGLHHWTVDAHEYATLISTYGWVGEGGSGFVVQ
jgi:uncharacterized protein DUF11/uncharacterized protein DUF5648